MKQICEITSRNNEKIKYASSLKDKSARTKSGLFLTEGIRLFTDAVRSGIEIKDIFVTPSALDTYAEVFNEFSGDVEGYILINDSVADKLTDTKSPQGVFCVCKVPEKQFDIKPEGLYLLTDNIQNPDNIGAIIRSAEALGFDGLIAGGGCDIYSPKAIRASMGGVLRFPVTSVPDAVTAVKSLREKGLKICATVPDSNAQDITKCGIHSCACLIIGNEGNGISEEVLSVCTDFLTIPMKGKAESLNASAAATIAIWEFCRG